MFIAFLVKILLTKRNASINGKNGNAIKISKVLLANNFASSLIVLLLIGADGVP
jgi:hypothetical protein